MADTFPEELAEGGGLDPPAGDPIRTRPLHLSGFALPLAELEAFRQWGSRTPGHPERGHTPGVETTTGPLGAGFASGVGMAIAEAFLAATFHRPGFKLLDQ